MTAGEAARVELSSAQRRLWFLGRIDPTSPAYVEARAFNVRGPLDVPALERALATVVRRQAALRTRFHTAGGAVSQSFDGSARELLEVVDLSGLPPPTREQRLEELLADGSSRCADLETAPPVKLLVVRLAARDHILGITAHRIVFDASSFELLAADLEAAYAAELDSRPVALEPIDRFVRLRDERASADLDFWRAKLAGAPSLELPADRPRPPRRSGRGAEHTVELPSEVVDGVLAFGRDAGVQPDATLAAAFAALLHRYSGHTEICLGWPTRNRRTPELALAVGAFDDVAVLRLTLADDPRFADLAAGTRRAVGEALAHAAPFDAVVEAVQPARDLSRAPLFQVSFSMLQRPRRSLELRGARVAERRLDEIGAELDVQLEITPRNGSLSCRFVYATDLFRPESVARIARHYVHLVADAVADPRRRLSELRLLTREEHETLTAEWNRTRVRYPRVPTHELIEAVADRAPDAIAVVGQDHHLTYSELEERSNRLAHELSARGVETGRRVAICLSRTPDLLVALLAVWKAGGAYVPLDPSYPVARNSFILADSSPAVLVRDGAADPSLRLEPERVVDLDRDWPAIAAERPSARLARLARACSAEDLAYVIYTSGSSGQPKGVEIEHASLVNLLTFVCRELGITEQDVYLATTTLTFDVAAVELYAPLLVGGQVALAPACAGDPEAFAQAVRIFRPTALQGTPTTWRLLVDWGWAGAPAKAISVGEALPTAVAHRLVDVGVEIWNFYGPTETTIYSTFERVRRDAEVTIGRPLANTAVYVLDEHLNPVPPGVPGDLYLAGDGLARGYHGQPDLTSERFVPNPFADVPGDRMYKTGDLARYLSDGRLDFLGRADGQVKIRGVRVELGEVEHRLGAHPGVEAVAAVVFEGERGNHLVAYVEPRPGVAPAAAELRRWVRQTLPDAMVPSELLFLDELPRTPNGKLDRKALPRPSHEGEPDAERQPPQTEPERELAAIWSRVLAVGEIGRDDDFFDLGGHSLAVLQVVAAASARFGVDVAPDLIFDAPTLGEFAAAVAGDDPAVGSSRKAL